MDLLSHRLLEEVFHEFVVITQVRDLHINWVTNSDILSSPDRCLHSIFDTLTTGLHNYFGSYYFIVTNVVVDKFFELETSAQPQ